MNDDIVSIDRQISELKSKKEQLITEAHANCNHPFSAVVECSFVAATYYTNAIKPVRVCTLCGYAEEGWGCGYWKLKQSECSDGAAPSYDRVEMFTKLVRRFWSQEMLNKVRFNKEKQKILIEARNKYYSDTGREVPK